MQIGSGTRALVTGASRGIGRALAHELAARGATVGLAARSVTDLEAVAAELPGAHHVLVCDVALRESVLAAVEEFVAATGGLDLLVVNAGVAHYEPIATQHVEKIELMTEVNWLGTVYTVKAALPHMLIRGGHIVVMSSGAGLRSFPRAAAYSATKAAQRMFAEALRHELAGSGVSLTTVYPSEIATSLHDHQAGRDAGLVSRRRARRARGGARRRASSRPSSATAATCTGRARVRGMGVLNGLSPRLADAVPARRVCAAPRARRRARDSHPSATLSLAADAGAVAALALRAVQLAVGAGDELVGGSSRRVHSAMPADAVRPAGQSWRRRSTTCSASRGVAARQDEPELLAAHARERRRSPARSRTSARRARAVRGRRPGGRGGRCRP